MSNINIIPQEGVSPVYNQKKSINLCFAFDDNFAKYFSVALQSLIDNADNYKNYDIIVFVSSLNNKNIDTLNSMLPVNFSLRFFNLSQFIKKYFSNLNFEFSRDYSIETFYRIFVPLVCSKYDRILYLDSDILILDNLSELFKIDMNNAQISVVKDMIAHLLHLDRNKQNLEHFEQTLKLKNKENYFNAGVLLFNNKNINIELYEKKMLIAAKVKKTIWVDQDIVNTIFQEKVNFIPPKWNLNCGDFAYNTELLKFLSNDIKNEMVEALDSPKIIHFISTTKPWIYKDMRFADKYWEFAQKTPYYNELDSLSSKFKISNFETFINKINSKSGSIILWGASVYLKTLIETYNVNEKKILGIIDNNPEKVGNFIGKYQIYSPKDIKQLDPNNIIVTIKNSTQNRMLEIKEFLKQNNILNINIDSI